MVRNLATSLVLYETVDTTKAKAKEVKQYMETLIARNKEADLSAIRALNAAFFDKNAVKKVIFELIPRYKERKSGFIKSFNLKNRSGDDALMTRLELVDKKVFVEKKAEPQEVSEVKDTEKPKKNKNEQK